jgi:hypothetical protein
MSKSYLASLIIVRPGPFIVQACQTTGALLVGDKDEVEKPVVRTALAPFFGRLNDHVGWVIFVKVSGWVLCWPAR